MLIDVFYPYQKNCIANTSKSDLAVAFMLGL
uniref:Uncharacterized protein n=1 Tax=Arundo donax TaxID=35708 RepID=A0A0A9EH26_ARUDO